jgi:hypothetical protein
MPDFPRQDWLYIAQKSGNVLININKNYLKIILFFVDKSVGREYYSVSGHKIKSGLQTAQSTESEC